MWILFGNSKVYYIAPALSWRPRVVSWLVVGFDVLLRRRLEIPSKMRARVYVHIHFHSSTTWFLVVIQGKLKNTLTKYIWNTIFFLYYISILFPKVYNVRRYPSFWLFGLYIEIFGRNHIFGEKLYISVEREMGTKREIFESSSSVAFQQRSKIHCRRHNVNHG